MHIDGTRKSANHGSRKPREMADTLIQACQEGREPHLGLDARVGSVAEQELHQLRLRRGCTKAKPWTSSPNEPANTRHIQNFRSQRTERNAAMGGGRGVNWQKPTETAGVQNRRNALHLQHTTPRVELPKQRRPSNPATARGKQIRCSLANLERHAKASAIRMQQLTQQRFGLKIDSKRTPSTTLTLMAHLTSPASRS
jgi:hypothetical protein